MGSTLFLHQRGGLVLWDSKYSVSTSGQVVLGFRSLWCSTLRPDQNDAVIVDWATIDIDEPCFCRRRERSGLPSNEKEKVKVKEEKRALVASCLRSRLDAKVWALLLLALCCC